MKDNIFTLIGMYLCLLGYFIIMGTFAVYVSIVTFFTGETLG